MPDFTGLPVVVAVNVASFLACRECANLLLASHSIRSVLVRDLGFHAALEHRLLTTIGFASVHVDKHPDGVVPKLAMCHRLSSLRNGGPTHVCGTVPSPHIGQCTSLAVMSDGSLLTGGSDGRLCIWNPTTWTRIAIDIAAPGTAIGVKSLIALRTPCGEPWVAAGFVCSAPEHSVKVWQEEKFLRGLTHSKRELWPGCKGTVRVLQHLDAVHLLAGTSTGLIGAWSAGDWVLAAKFQAHTDEVNALTSVGFGRFASSGDDCKVKLWTTRTWSCERVVSFDEICLGMILRGAELIVTTTEPVEPRQSLDCRAFRVDLETGKKRAVCASGGGADVLFQGEAFAMLRALTADDLLCGIMRCGKVLVATTYSGAVVVLDQDWKVVRRFEYAGLGDPDIVAAAPGVLCGDLVVVHGANFCLNVLSV